MRSIFVVYEFKSDLKNILDLLCSLYEKKVSQCVISDQICSHFLRGDVYILFFLAHSIIRFADSLQKKGDYSHQTSKKINAIQYNEKSDLFRSCLFSLLFRIWGVFLLKIRASLNLMWDSWFVFWGSTRLFCKHLLILLTGSNNWFIRFVSKNWSTNSWKFLFVVSEFVVVSGDQDTI